MKTNWQTKRLDQLDGVSFLRGNGLNKSLIDDQGEFKCILYGELYTKYKDPVIKEIISRTSFEGKVKSEVGDILVPGTTTADAYGIAIARSLNKKGIVLGGDINVVRTKNKEVISDFLSYYLNGPAKNELASHATGTNIMHLSNKKIQSIEISYPDSLSEQKRIVKILDEVFEKIDAARKNAEKNLQNSKELFGSFLDSIFANTDNKWELVKLSDIASDITDGDHMPPPKASSGVPFITISNINKISHEIDFSDTFKVSREYYQKLKDNKKPKKGDVLYTVTGSFGIPVIVESNFEFCFQRHIGLIRPLLTTNPKWLYYLIMSPQILAQGKDGATGTAQKTVSLKVLRNFAVPKISLSEQEKIVKKLDSLSEQTKKLEAIYIQKIADLDELKKSALSKAFAGEL